MALSDRQHHPPRQVVASLVGTNGTNIHVDNDDDGESAAGGRLAHLLQILVCKYYSYADTHFHSTFLGGQQCAGHRDALLWRNPFRTG